MIPTATITSALETYIAGTGLFDRVSRHEAADLAEALEALRDPDAKLCFVIAGADTLEHKLLEDYNAPLRSEMRCEAQVLVSSQDAAYGTGGDERVLPLKDHLLALLMWDNLGVPGLLCLPTRCEPLRIEWDDAPGRSAWQMDVEIRQRINP